MPNISWWEILLLVLVVLLIFGPKKLPQIGRSMGRGVREFKDTVTDQTKELKEAVGDTPKEFKGALHPFKDEKKEEPEPIPVPGEREVVVTTQEDVAAVQGDSTSEPVATEAAPVSAPANGSDPSKRS
jgi:sec-independent protein translocase protein TatA